MCFLSARASCSKAQHTERQCTRRLAAVAHLGIGEPVSRGDLGSADPISNVYKVVLPLELPMAQSKCGKTHCALHPKQASTQYKRSLALMSDYLCLLRGLDQLHARRMECHVWQIAVPHASVRSAHAGRGLRRVCRHASSLKGRESTNLVLHGA